MPNRSCLDCGHLVRDASRCPACTARRSHQRDTQRPGHRAEHRRARALVEPLVAAGVTCSRCGYAIEAGKRDVDRRPWGWEPSHATCNRAAGGRGDP